MRRLPGEDLYAAGTETAKTPRKGRLYSAGVQQSTSALGIAHVCSLPAVEADGAAGNRGGAGRGAARDSQAGQARSGRVELLPLVEHRDFARSWGVE